MLLIAFNPSAAARVAPVSRPPMLHLFVARWPAFLGNIWSGFLYHLLIIDFGTLSFGIDLQRAG